MLLLVCCLLKLLTDNEERCYTPSGANGNCMDLKVCQSLYSLLMKKPINYDDIDFLRRSNCGFIDNKPFVCCPPEEARTPKPVKDNHGKYLLLLVHLNH